VSTKKIAPLPYYPNREPGRTARKRAYNDIPGLETAVLKAAMAEYMLRFEDADASEEETDAAGMALCLACEDLRVAYLAVAKGKAAT
jgi:hypothetical protein